MDIQSILNDMVGVGEDKDTILKMFKKLEEENKELKEANEKLENERDGLIDDVDNVVVEKNELEGTYLDIINELGDYMARIDQNAVDVFNEITEDSEHVPSRTLE